MSATGLLLTTGGFAAIAADLSGGADLALTHVAWGDAGGVPYTPTASQTALVNERYRATIASVAVVDGVIVVDAILPADTNDASARPSHGFNVAECGLFSSAGTLIGVAGMEGGFKPSPSSGQAVSATYRLKLAIANPGAITVVIDAQQQVHVGRNVRPFWMTVDGILNTPPASPTIGATYVIGEAPTGAWSSFTARIVQWVGVWAISTPPDGHIVANNAVASNAAGRHLKKVGASWVNWYADSTVIGPILRASDATAVAGNDSASALTPRHASLLAQAAPFTQAVAAGTANNITAALAPAPAAYVVGMLVFITIAAANTGAVTINVNGLGAKPIIRADGNAMRPGELVAGAFTSLIYDGTSFQVLNFAGGDATVPTGFVGVWSQTLSNGVQTDIAAYTAHENNLIDATLSGGVLTLGPKSAGIWAIIFTVISPSANVEILGSILDAATGGAGIGYGTSQTASGAPGISAVSIIRRSSGQAIRAQARYIQAAFPTLALSGRIHLFRLGA